MAALSRKYQSSQIHDSTWRQLPGSMSQQSTVEASKQGAAGGLNRFSSANSSQARQFFLACSGYLGGAQRAGEETAAPKNVWYFRKNNLHTNKGCGLVVNWSCLSVSRLSGNSGSGSGFGCVTVSQTAGSV